MLHLEGVGLPGTLPAGGFGSPLGQSLSKGSFLGLVCRRDFFCIVIFSSLPAGYFRFVWDGSTGLSLSSIEIRSKACVL